MNKSRKDLSLAIPDYVEDHSRAAAKTVDAPRVLLVTGMSGAGKTSALKSLEDLGFEAIDNVPMSLIGNLVAPAQPELSGAISRPIAIGIDIRTRDFGARAFLEQLARLGEAGGEPAAVLFLDCDDEELRRRYTETRHRHPLAQDRPVGDGIALERRLVSLLRERADVVLDTTGLAPGELKDIIHGHFGPAGKKALSILVMSFSYRRGIPVRPTLFLMFAFSPTPTMIRP